MKKIVALLAIVGNCITAPETVLAMRTGQTRKEATQAHRVALKNARRITRQAAKLVIEQKQAVASTNPYATFNKGQFEWPSHGSYEGDRRRCLVFANSHASYIVVFALITGLLIQSAQAYNLDGKSDGKLERVANIATSPAHILAIGGLSATAGMADLIMKAARSGSLEGALDGKLGNLADKAGRLMQDYHDYEETDPVKAKLALSSCMILGKTVAGAVAGGLATAPAGGEGAIPGALYGLSKGITDEMRGIVIGKALEVVAGDKFEALIQRSIEKCAPGVIYLDRTLTEQQAKYMIILLGVAGLSSAEFTSVINKLGQIDLGNFKFPIRYDLGKEIGHAPTTSLGTAIRDDLESGLEPGLEHVYEHVYMHHVQEALLHPQTGSATSTPELSMPTSVTNTAEKLFSAEAYQQWQAQASTLHVSPIKQFQNAQIPSQGFMNTAEKLFSAEGYQQWKIESSNVMHLPAERLIDLKFPHDGVMYGAAANEWFNDQYRKKMGF